jgi:hypothetical protein
MRIDDVVHTVSLHGPAFRALVTEGHEIDALLPLELPRTDEMVSVQGAS